MAQMTLAMALLRRKELQEKVNQLRTIKDRDLYEVKATRRNVTENIDEIIANVPKLTASQVTEEFDHYARQLRLCDAAIQQANWSTNIEVADTVNNDYVKRPA